MGVPGTFIFSHPGSNMAQNCIDEPRIPGFYETDFIKTSCKPFKIVRNHPRAMMFIHGLTGSPADYRAYAAPFVAAGYDVFVPLWPGHGSHISFLEHLGYRELFIPFAPLMNYLTRHYQEVHITALSYGAIIGADLALGHSLNTISFLAPAFLLNDVQERNMAWVKRLKMYRYRSRVTKKKINPKFTGDGTTYNEIALLPAVELHKRCARIKGTLKGLSLPVFHAHGEEDGTTPAQPNHQFLKNTFPDYRFLLVKGAKHVLPVEPGWEDLVCEHLKWLKGP